MIRVRIPPSPTGKMHLGTAYTTLFNYLFAKKNKGTFIFRFEDTDQTRSKKEFEKDISESMLWLGLKWDEGPFRQMERLENYNRACAKLLEGKKAYYCFCTPEELEHVRQEQTQKKLPLIYSGKCRNLPNEDIEKFKKEGKPYATRFKMPEDRRMIVFDDLIHGKVETNSSLIGDFVIMRGSGIPIYNFAVVIDDIDMKITHVLRGEDHLSNTPKQVVLFEALEANLPEFAHWPNILNSDRIGKLSKREGATSVSDYRKDGFLPEAIVNYLALIGWTMPEQREIMSLKEMEETFDLSKMRKSPAAFDIIKLEWMNGEYIRKTQNSNLRSQIFEYLRQLSDGALSKTDHPTESEIEQLIPLVKDRIKKLSDYIPLTDFFFEKVEYEKEIFNKLKIDNLKEILEKVLEKMERMEVPWTAEIFEQTFRELAEDLSLSASQMFQLIRVAVSGQLVTPPLFESIKILGEEEAIKRVKEALSYIT